MTTRVIEKPRLSYKSRGPGPAYSLPPVLGFEKHDLSRKRNPAYSITARHDEKLYVTASPGPNKYNTYHLTRQGIEKPPAFSIAGRAPFVVIGSGPGPGAYHPETCPPVNHSRTSPSFSIQSRLKPDRLSLDGPGPNSYVVPSCLGPKIPHKKTCGAVSLKGRSSDSSKNVGPGPADYGNPNYNVVKKQYPAFSLKFRQQPLSSYSSGPGPMYNPTYNPRKQPPAFSFGIRHSECEAQPCTYLKN
ncbi:outer dense fiber protein 3-like protein 2 [Cotesia glomerata]|uniref:outer dense fiber protein 3-like protein 2 n=1 Tax=Cotesia glomerata TaxID=32391 RepID=UPI001D01D65E|nr:outer dense fiber protein 3-like protein 2 [Cotesia glomerata]